VTVPASRLNDPGKLWIRLWIHEVGVVWGDRLTAVDIFPGGAENLSMTHFKQGIDKNPYSVLTEAPDLQISAQNLLPCLHYPLGDDHLRIPPLDGIQHPSTTCLMKIRSAASDARFPKEFLSEQLLIRKLFPLKILWASLTISVIELLANGVQAFRLQLLLFHN
jgi:hypothetical protein